MTLADIAERLGCRLDGDGRIEVTRVAGLEDAGPGDLSFLSNPRYASKLRTTKASAVILDETAAGAPCAMLRTAQPYLALANAVALLTPERRPPPGISPLASIDASADLGPAVHVGAFAVIGARTRIGRGAVIHAHGVIGDDVVLGDDCVIHAHVSIRDGVTLGARCVIQAGAVIGSDGFGFARRPDGSHQKIPQVGRVIIEDDVEIGAQSAVDRPAFGETRIGAGTKIDNLVQIAHGVKIGRHALLAAQSGIAGSSVLGDGVVLAGQSGVSGHLTLGAGVVVRAKSAVTKDVKPGSQVAGIPAGNAGEWRQQVVQIRKLRELRRTLLDLAARLRALEKKSGSP